MALNIALRSGIDVGRHTQRRASRQGTDGRNCDAANGENLLDHGVTSGEHRMSPDGAHRKSPERWLLDSVYMVRGTAAISSVPVRPGRRTRKPGGSARSAER